MIKKEELFNIAVEKWIERIEADVRAAAETGAFSFKLSFPPESVRSSTQFKEFWEHLSSEGILGEVEEEFYTICWEGANVDDFSGEKEETTVGSSKPNWNDAPEWANYLAQEENGEWYWYEKRPTVDNQLKCWNLSWYDQEFAGYGEPNPNWQDALEKRPN